MTRRPAAVVLAVLAVLVAAATLAACGLPHDPTYRSINGNEVGFGLLETTTSSSTSTTSTTIAPVTTVAVPTSTTVPTTEPVTLYYVLGTRLAPVTRSMAKPVSPTDAMVALQLGPEVGDKPVGLRSSVQPDMIGEVKVVGGTARVDLAPSLLTLSQQEQILAFGQIVGTLTDRPGIGRVSFTVAGKPVDAQRGDGSLASDSVSRDDYLNLLPASPGETPSTTAPASTTTTAKPGPTPAAAPAAPTTAPAAPPTSR